MLGCRRTEQSLGMYSPTLRSTQYRALATVAAGSCRHADDSPARVSTTVTCLQKSAQTSSAQTSTPPYDSYFEVYLYGQVGEEDKGRLDALQRTHRLELIDLQPSQRVHIGASTAAVAPVSERR
jgi:hypothetical protein